MAPFDLTALGPWGFNGIIIVFGFVFGFILESSGFGDSRKLAGQFFFAEQTVVKVMFTSIVVNMLLISLAASLGWVNFDELFVNPTFLWPGIVGGLVMGVGFIIGGYCPGTSLVSLATMKLDGAFFVLGAAIGIFFFGETVGLYTDFFESSDMGRYTLMDWLNLDFGLVALLVVFMAISMYAGFDWINRRFHSGEMPSKKAITWQLAGAGFAILFALVIWGIGQPTMSDKWDYMASKHQPALDDREVQLDPAEVVSLMEDDLVELHLMDIRSESDWNVFRIYGSQHVDANALESNRYFFEHLPPNGVIVLIGNDEDAATEAWKLVMTMGAPNVYILEGGINHWLDVYDHDSEGKIAEGLPDDQLRHPFKAAVGQRHPAARPDSHHGPHREFESKVKLQIKAAKAGGCG